MLCIQAQRGRLELYPIISTQQGALLRRNSGYHVCNVLKLEATAHPVAHRMIRDSQLYQSLFYSPKTFCKFLDQNHSIGCSEVKSDIEKPDGSQDRPQNSNKTAFILKSFPARFADRSCWIYIYSIMIKFLFVWAFGRAHRAVMSFAIRIAQIYSTYRQL